MLDGIGNARCKENVLRERSHRERDLGDGRKSNDGNGRQPRDSGGRWPLARSARRGVEQILRGHGRAGTCGPVPARGRGARAARRKRCGQVDAGQDPDRRGDPRSRRDAASRRRIRPPVDHRGACLRRGDGVPGTEPRAQPDRGREPPVAGPAKGARLARLPAPRTGGRARDSRPARPGPDRPRRGGARAAPRGAAAHRDHPRHRGGGAGADPRRTDRRPGRNRLAVRADRKGQGARRGDPLHFAPPGRGPRDLYHGDGAAQRPVHRLGRPWRGERQRHLRDDGRSSRRACPSGAAAAG